jgi:hypothetical protein
MGDLIEIQQGEVSSSSLEDFQSINVSSITAAKAQKHSGVSGCHTCAAWRENARSTMILGR